MLLLVTEDIQVSTILSPISGKRRVLKVEYTAERPDRIQPNQKKIRIEIEQEYKNQKQLN